MKSWTWRVSSALLATGAVLWISGCLSAKYLAMVRYDQVRDEFHLLNVYQRIAAGQPEDSEYLFQLWRNRDHLIRVPNVDIFGMSAFVRMSPNRYAAINLGTAAAKLEPAQTTIPLDQIRVSPGTFFLRGADTLCYYDQVVIPGKVIDAALPVFARALAPGTIDGIDKELQRRKDGGELVRWDEFRQQIIEGVHSSANPTTAPATQPTESKGDLNQVIDDESLQLIRKNAVDGGLNFARQKQVFRVVVPLSDADAHQAELAWHALLDAIKTNAPNAAAGSDVVVMAKIQSAFTFSIRPKAVEFQVDLAVIIDRLPEIASITKDLDEPKPEELKSMRDTIAALRRHGVPIDEKVTVEQLAKDFMTDSVKSYPSDHPVEPGSGLVQNADATTPPEKK